MAANTITRQMNQSFLTRMFSQSKSKTGRLSRAFKGNTVTNIASSMTLNIWDSFRSSSTSSLSLLQSTVRKMQTINNQLTIVPLRSSGLNLLNGTRLEAPALPQPTQADIEQFVADAGGHEVLQPWLVDGKTKILYDNRKVVVDVTGGQPAAEPAENGGGDTRQAASDALARFGLDSSLLDEDAGVVRESLKQAAAGFSGDNPNLGLAIEYALEDAYAKIDAYDNARQGKPAQLDYEKQVEKNLAQAKDVAAQLGLGDSEVWGIDSLAQDLAVFGMDLTAMSKDPGQLAQAIKDKSLQLLADLDERYVGTEADYHSSRNRITGASARLVNGLQGAGGSLIRASLSVSSSVSSSQVSVNVDGVKVDANAIIAVGNVIVDPLVLDLNGDGIDLKGADEGVDFDMNGDGSKTGMGFIRGDDAFLFLDTHGDGVVHDGRQLFGNTGGHANGFEMLRQYDDNGDGVIDENDAVYDQLRLWVEKTEDGVCGQDETMSLREAGIKSINLGYENVREDDGKGNLIGQTGGFTRDDGSTGLAADVWLQEKNQL